MAFGNHIFSCVIWWRQSMARALAELSGNLHLIWRSGYQNLKVVPVSFALKRDDWAPLHVTLCMYSFKLTHLWRKNLRYFYVNWELWKTKEWKDDTVIDLFNKRLGTTSCNVVYRFKLRKFWYKILYQLNLRHLYVNWELWKTKDL